MHRIERLIVLYQIVQGDVHFYLILSSLFYALAIDDDMMSNK